MENYADMSELSDEADLKSADEFIVWVRVPLSALQQKHVFKRLEECMSNNSIQETFLVEKGGVVSAVTMGEKGYSILPKIIDDIVNVSNPNPQTVFVEFADGTKEIARVEKGDTFCFETGIMICLMKKILSNLSNGRMSGSSLYNKLMDYAIGKIDAKRKAHNEAVKKEKEMKKSERKHCETNKDAELNKCDDDDDNDGDVFMYDTLKLLLSKLF